MAQQNHFRYIARDQISNVWALPWGMHRDSKGWRAQNRRTGSSVERYNTRRHLDAEPDLGIARNFWFAVKCFEECWVCCPPIWRLISARQTPSSDRKSTRLNSSHGSISYAVFCL